MPHYTALVTLLAIGLFFYSGLLVGMERSKTGVKAPATTGHPDFERAFRVQMNTLESSVMFLPALWVAAFYGTPSLVPAAGLVWVLGRVLYGVGYLRAPEKRSIGFGVGALGFVVLLADGAIGVVRSALA